MKRKHISVTALAAVLVVMCITTTVFASAAPEDSTRQDPHGNAPETGFVYDHLGLVEDIGVTILSKGGEDGEKLYSVDDGKTWMSEERYHAEYGSWGDDWQVEWWTYEDYKAWLEEEKIALQSIIGERGYNSTLGWFTWDQKMVDEAIAMYEGILEDIKNGALYSKTIIDKNGNEVEDTMLGSDGVVIATVCEMDDNVVVSPKSPKETKLPEELKNFGISGNDNLLYYNGELVRTLVDGVPVGDNGYSVSYIYHNDAGTVDLHTLRAVIHNPDGSWNPMGDLIGLAKPGDENFDPELLACGIYSDVPQATTESGPSEPGAGVTFEEIFARYAAYGLDYRPGEGMGTMTLNGQTVKSFADLKPDGGVFSWQDPKAEDGLRVRTEYDQDGNLTGLSAE